MKKLLIIFFILPLFTNAQTSYDRKQDLKIVALQKTADSLRTDNAAIKKNVAALISSSAKMQQKLDSFRVVIIAFEKTQFNVSDIIKGPTADTIKVQSKLR